VTENAHIQTAKSDLRADINGRSVKVRAAPHVSITQWTQRNWSWVWNNTTNISNQ